MSFDNVVDSTREHRRNLSLAATIEKPFEKLGTLRSIFLIFVIVSFLPIIISFILPLFDHSDPVKNIQDLTVMFVSFLAWTTLNFSIAGPLDYLFAGALILFLKKFKTGFVIAASGFIWMYLWMMLGTALIDFGTRKDIDNTLRIVAMATYCGNTFGLCTISYMLPSIVAFHRKKKNRWRYFGLNFFFAVIPAVWPVMLFNAFRNDKDPNAKPTAAELDKAAAAKKRRRKK